MHKENILEYVLNAGSNSVEVFGGRYDGGYELQQCPQEITEFLFKYQWKEIENFLEIGVAAGGNTRIFCDFLKIENVFTIDLDEHPSIDGESNPKAREKNFSQLRNSGILKSFYGDSHSFEADQWLKDTQVSFDMAFIDGDHTELGIYQDTLLVLPYLKDGAYVIYHDTLINVGSYQFDIKLKEGLIPNLKHEEDFFDTSIYRKGISVYKFSKL
jgi:predicted O-methyltransferase YrrM